MANLKKGVNDIYRLTPMQEGMLFHYLMDRKSSAYFEQSVLSINGEIDKELFERSLNIVVGRHDMLRTAFVYEDMKRPLQAVLKERRSGVLLEDISGYGEEEKLERLEKIKTEDRERGFDLTKDSLMRVIIVRLDEREYRLIWSFHHIIMDGWCLELVAGEVFTVYGLIKGKGIADERLIEKELGGVYPYSSYIKWLEKQDGAESIKYWEKYLEGYRQQAALPGIRGEKSAYIPGELEFVIDESITKKLVEIARENQATLNTVMQSVWGIILQKYNNTHDVVFGGVVSGRPPEINGIERMVGLFINTVPVRIRSEEGQTFEGLVKQVQKGSLDAKRHEYVSLAEIQSATELKQGLIDHIIVFENYLAEGRIEGMGGMTGFEVNGLEVFEQTNYNFNIIIIPGKEISVRLMYNLAVYQKDMIEMVAGHIKNVIADIAEKPCMALNEIEVLTEEEKRKILCDFNNTDAEYPGDKTIHQLFQEQVERTPDNTAVIFKDRALSYRELNQRANRLAQTLREKGVKSDSIVAIMTERSPEMAVGIMGILKAGGAYLTISPSYPEDRISYMLEDSGAEILLIGNRLWAIGNGKNIQVIALEDESSYSGDGANLENINKPTDLAYVIYTSGSTGKPKGAMIEHLSVINRLNWMQRSYPINDGDVILQKTPYTFDVSVWELLWWSLQGAGVCFLVPGGEKDPGEIMNAVHKSKVTVMHFVPSMLSVFLDYMEERSDIDKLSGLKHVFASGEALTLNQVRRFNSILNKRYGTLLHNLYGPTEATVDVSYFECSTGEELETVPIGKPIDNIKLYILDKSNRLQPVGIPGELCISGVGVGRGYLNKPGLTTEKFIPNPFIQPLASGFRPLIYRTGDLARWLPDGNIEFLGRIDHQVKIRGYRIELGEIESQLLSHGSVKEAVVTVREDGNAGKSLCAYFVSDESLTAGELREYLSKSLPDYMVPSYFIRLESMPLTNNGKVDRKDLPEPGGVINTGAEYTPPADETEARLVDIWQNILGVDRIGTGDSFFDLGGHSLKAATLVSRIHRELNVEVPLAQVFRAPTIKGLAEYVKGAGVSMYSSIQPVEEKEYYSLSSAQKRLYILDSLEKNSVSYNMPQAMILEGVLDRERLEKVFKGLVNRHESLRTSIESVNGEPVQRIHRDIEFKIGYMDRSGEGNEKTASFMGEFIRPFDLSKAPLLRVGLVKLSQDKHLLMFDMHHIISDGISMGILTREFAYMYGGGELSPLRIQYKDFSHWQNELVGTERLKKQEEYWLNRFAGEIPLLDMPLDYPRPSIQSFEGDSIPFECDGKQVANLNKVGAQCGATLYMVLLAAYNVLLARYTGQEDIVVGSPIAGRHHADLENIIGVFVNTLAMRNKPERDKTFREFLLEIRENALGAYGNQDYQFEELVNRLNVRRDLSRNPLFDTMLILQNIEAGLQDIEGLKSLPYDSGHRISKFDFMLQALEVNGTLRFNLEYCTRLFKKETMERLARHFTNILDTVTRNPDIRLSDIEVLTEEEKRRILCDFNDTDAEYPGDKTIHQLFEEQVERTPDNTAVIFKDRMLTYRELNKKANRLARVLREKGVKSDSIVAIMTERSPEMAVGIMGILKAGGAYLPISPAYPEDRISYMLEDSGAALLLENGEHGTENREKLVNGIDLGDESLYTGDGSNLENINKPADLAYVIYTSGSTGKPKGAMIEHRSVINRLNWMQKSYPINEGDVILQKTPYTFDVSVWELLWWSLQGAGVCFLVPGGEKDPGEIMDAVHKNKVTVMHFVPSMLSIFLDYIEERSDIDKLSGLKHVFASGEALTLNQVRRFNSILNKRYGTLLHNLYGPTEATVDVSYFECSTGEDLETVPIGKPIDNIKLYILDKSNRLQPVGIPGELCISGVGVGRGYLNKPGLTAEKFIPNPFIQPLASGFRPLIYRTGDLARWLPDGNIEFLGRIDHQVKIRGYRIELGEIESQLQSHNSVREAVVMVREDGNAGKSLCAYFVSDESLTAMELREYLSKSLPDYMVPSYFIRLESMPLTNNGKVDRKALPEPVGGINTGAEYMPPADETEARLVDIWQNILEVDRIGTGDSFFELGGHSLKAATLVSRIHRELNVEVPLAQVFRTPTIKGLAEYVKGAGVSMYSSIQPVEEKEYYSLSSAQKRLYILDSLEENSISYNMPQAMILEGALERERLEKVFQGLVNRHESLRTSIESINGEPVQRIHRDIEFKIGYMDRSGEENEKTASFMEGFIRPFDLSKAPLLRVGLVKLSQDRHLLMFDMHHIISDGVSMGILMQEFARMYGGGELPPLRIQYKDFSHWQNELVGTERLKKQEEYWLGRFVGEIPLLDMPLDYPRPSIQSFEGDSIPFECDGKQVANLNKVGAQCGATLYMVLLAAYNVLLARYTGQEDIVVGSPIAGRHHADLENIIGVFVNTLAMRNKPERDKTFREFLLEIRENALGAYGNQDCQFEELVNRLNVRRDLSRNPLFDTMLILQNMEAGPQDIPGLKFTPYDPGYRVSKFDFTLQAEESDGRLRFNLEYCTKLFKKETMERLAEHFTNILDIVTENPDIRLSDIEMPTTEKKKEILCEFSNTDVEYQKGKTVHRLFEEQVERTPDNKAVVFEDTTLTYRELNIKANKMAHVLESEGVRPDEPVGIMAGRGVGMLTGILGILKAGGAYVPIDPEYPQARVGYMLRHSGTRVLITEGGLSEEVQSLMEDGNGVEVIISLSGGIDGEIKGIRRIYSPGDTENQGTDNLHNGCCEDNLMYIIYTSGSTGLPKGVMVTHSNAANYLQWSIKDGKIEPSDRMMLVTSMSFDISVFEMFGALLSGACLSIVPGDRLRDASALLQYMDRTGVSIWHSVPTLMAQALLLLKSVPEREKPACLSTVRRIMIGGEAWSVELAKEIRENFKNAEIVNMYGPTEATIWVTSYKIGEELDNLASIPIGRPIANNRVLILDPGRKLCGIGIPGDIYVSGANITRGYYRDEAKTAEAYSCWEETGEIIYRTGDTGRYLSDGNVEYLGRKDGMVKVRGYRIEVGEIENVMLADERISQAAVIARKDGETSKLVCFYVSEKEVGTAGLKDSLGAKLPDYMLPSQFVRLEKMPLTPNGKIDRKALAAMELAGGAHQGVEYIEPASGTEKQLVEIWRNLLGINRIGVNDNFFEIGGNSFLVSRMQYEIELKYPGKVKVVDIFRYPAISKLAVYIGREERTPGAVKREEGEASGDMAIIGLSVRMPMAGNDEEFWNILKEGVDCIRELPDYRKKDIEDLRRFTGKGEILEYGTGGYLDDIDRFDHSFFRLSPAEASMMDPAQRLFLQTAWNTIEDAGYGGGIISGRKVGVYVGYSSDSGIEYKGIVHELAPSSAGLAVSGNIKSIIASRISYLLDLKGPSMMVDTACSSALVAVHLACRAIRGGECEMAIAGGVKVSIIPLKADKQSGIGIESSDGRARTFDDSSDGTGNGEGIAAVLLKPLKKAVEDRDHIYAVIKGSAVNQDGSSIGITAPNSAAQEDVIASAWQDAKIDPSTVSYIEAHGTGTSLGDPIEIDGIEGAFRRYTDRKQFCAVGSIKTNIGHLDNTAGIAGLVKAVLSLKNKKIPPSLHFKKPNRKISFEESPVYVSDRLTDWVTDGIPRRCGVSSFGLSGTNCHVVLEEYNCQQGDTPADNAGRPHVFTMSAKNEEVLKELINSYSSFIEGLEADIEDICYTANTGRDDHACRLALLIRDKNDFKEKLEGLRAGKLESNQEKGIFYGECRNVNAPVEMREVSDLAGICRAYVGGAAIGWAELYKEQKRRRVKLPVYPFMQKRCWVEPEKTQNPGHPLLGACLAESMGIDIYSTTFNVDRYWVLNEHRILGNYVVPGTTYVEMAGELGRRYYPGQCVELRDVVFISPMAVNEGSKELQTVVKEEGFREFTAASKSGHDGKWVKHGEGKILGAGSLKAAKYDIDGIKGRLGREQTLDYDDVPADAPGMGVDVGPRFRNLRTVWIGEGEALGYLELRPEYLKDLQEYYLHPALMDSAVNMANGQISGGLYLPLSYRSLKILGPMPGRIYSYLRRKTKGKETLETASFDISITDENGRAFIEIEDYTVKKVHNSEIKSLEVPGWMGEYYRLSWTKQELKEKRQLSSDGAVLILKDGKGIGDTIAMRLRESGQEVLEVGYDTAGRTEESYNKFIAGLNGKKLSRVIHLMTITGAGEPGSMDELQDSLSRGVDSLFFLTRALLNGRNNNEMDIVLISDYVNEVTGDEQRINPHNAAFFGLSKVVGQEYFHLRCRCVDIDDGTTVEDILSELSGGDNAFLAAYRGGARYVEEFGKLDKKAVSPQRLELEDGGVYVITGGMGGIGLEMGKYLASRSKVRLCLINRSSVPGREEWESILRKNEDERLCKKIKAIMEMEEAGAEVTALMADVSKPEELEPTIKEIKSRYGRIDGVIHGAGVAGDGFLFKKTKETFDLCLAPKLQGTWLLDRLTREEELDFFITFSSITSLFGAPGQGDYTAANSYLDSFTAFRNKHGRKALSINWPAWRDTGMAVDHGVSGDGTLFEPLGTIDAVRAFEELMGSSLYRVVPGRLNYKVLVSIDALPVRVSEDIKEAVEKKRRRQDTGSGAGVERKGMTGAVPGGKSGGYSETEYRLARVWGAVLGMEEVNVYDHFSDLGGDSIFATRLLREMEKEFPGMVDISDVFTYSTISEMAEYIDGRLNPEATGENLDSGEEDMADILARLARGEMDVDEAYELMNQGDEE